MNRNSTAVCGHGADRRHRGADIRDPGLGKVYSADRTAADRTAALGGLAGGKPDCGAARGPPGRCACWSAGDSRGGTWAAPGAMPTQCPPIGTKIKSPCNSTRAPPLGRVTIFWFEGAVWGHRRTKWFAPTGDFGPDLPH